MIQSTQEYEVPVGWRQIKIDDIANPEIRWSFTGGPFGSSLKQNSYTESGIRIIQLQNIGDGTFYDQYKIFTSIEKADELISCNIFPGDIILSKMGDPVARACIIPKVEDRYLMSSDGIRLAPDDKRFNRYFISLAINSQYFRTLAERSSTGSTRKRIGLSTLRKLKLLVPNLSEQNRIVAILETWDKAVERLKRKIVIKKSIRRGLLQKLIIGQTRVPGFLDNWNMFEISDFAELANILNGSDKQYEVLSCTKHFGLVRSLEYFDRKVYGDDLSKYKIVPRHYFAYATNHIEEGSIGYQDLVDYGLVSPMYTVFKTNGVNDSFLFMLLKTPRMIFEYQRRMTASVERRGGLRWGTFSKIKVKLPSREEQNAIANILLTANKEIQALETKLRLLQDQKKFLLNNLITGAIRTPEFLNPSKL